MFSDGIDSAISRPAGIFVRTPKSKLLPLLVHCGQNERFLTGPDRSELKYFSIPLALGAATASELAM